MRVKYYEDNLNLNQMKKEEILKLLRDENSKQFILSELGDIDESEIIQAMIGLFDDVRIEIRGEVFSSLFLNSNDILDELILGLRHQSKSVRAYTTLVLANRGEKRAKEEIKRLTNDPSGLVRTCAYGALGHLEIIDAAEELHRGIFDSNVEAVKSAAYGLSRIGEEISKDELEELQRSEDPDFEKILKFFN